MIKLFEKVIRPLGCHGSGVEMFVAGLRNDAVTPVTGHSVLVDEAHGVQTEVGFARETRGRWLWSLDKGERCRMRAQIFFERRAGQVGQIRGGNCRQHVEEILAVACGKGVRRVGHDIRVYPLGEVKTDATTSRVGIGVIVRNDRNTSGGGKTYRRGRGWPVEMGRLAEGSRL